MVTIQSTPVSSDKKPAACRARTRHRTCTQCVFVQRYAHKIKGKLCHRQNYHRLLASKWWQVLHCAALLFGTDRTVSLPNWIPKNFTCAEQKFRNAFEFVQEGSSYGTTRSREVGRAVKTLLLPIEELIWIWSLRPRFQHLCTRKSRSTYDVCVHDAEVRTSTSTQEGV